MKLQAQQEKISKWKHSEKKDLKVISRDAIMCETTLNGLHTCNWSPRGMKGTKVFEKVMTTFYNLTKP